MTADKRRKKPREVPRPKQGERPSAGRVRSEYEQRANAQGRKVMGHRQMLAAFAEQRGIVGYAA